MPLSFYWWGTLYFTLGCFLLQSLQFNWDHLGVLTSKHTYCCCNGNSHTTCSTRPPQQVTIQQEWLPLCQYREWLTKVSQVVCTMEHPANTLNLWSQPTCHLWMISTNVFCILTTSRVVHWSLIISTNVLTSSSVNVASSNHIMLQFPRNTVSGLWGCFMRGRSVFLFAQMQQAWYVIIIYML